MLRPIAIIFSSIAAILSFAWVVRNPTIESGIALTAAIAAFAGSFLLNEKSEAGQSQKVAANATGIQAGRDIHMRDNTKK